MNCLESFYTFILHTLGENKDQIESIKLYSHKQSNCILFFNKYTPLLLFCLLALLSGVFFMQHMAKQNWILKSHLCAVGEMTTIKMWD